MTALAAVVARRLGWSPTSSDAALGAPLHDVGKLAISGQVLLKRASWTPSELAEIRQHPTIGARIMQWSAVCARRSRRAPPPRALGRARLSVGHGR